MTDLSIQPAPLVPFQSDWIFWVFFGIFLLIAWIQVFYASRLRLIFRASFFTRDLHQLIREGNIFNQRISIAVSLLYVLILAMVILMTLQMVFDRTSFSISPIRLYFLLALVVTGFWALKAFIMNFLSVIFKTETINYEYQVNLFVTLAVLAILLLPVMVITVYLKMAWMIYFAFGLIVFFSVFRLFKGFLIGLSLTRFSYFFLFVYLCTLEILPLLVAAKLILTYF